MTTADVVVVVRLNGLDTEGESDLDQIEAQVHANISSMQMCSAYREAFNAGGVEDVSVESVSSGVFYFEVTIQPVLHARVAVEASNVDAARNDVLQAIRYDISFSDPDEKPDEWLLTEESVDAVANEVEEDGTLMPWAR